MIEDKEVDLLQDVAKTILPLLQEEIKLRGPDLSPPEQVRIRTIILLGMFADSLALLEITYEKTDIVGPTREASLQQISKNIDHFREKHLAAYHKHRAAQRTSK